jgi:general stress protein YciG
VKIMANEKNSNRGLASADERTRREVASKGGSAPHQKRGLQASDEQTKKRVSQAGGHASHSGGRRSSQ